MSQEDLVSIIVITYNSEDTILETLESIKSQIYEPLELIVSDDKSTDNTVAVVQEWLQRNTRRFVNTELVSAKINKGVSANCNQGIFRSKGSWFKLIAGDDVLFSNCISDNVDFATNNPNARFILSKVKVFKSGDVKNTFVDSNWSKDKENFFNADAKRQLNYFLTGNSIWSVSLFCHKQTFDILGGYDERKNFIEDYPFYLKLTHHNYKVNFLDEFTVGYRIQENSLSSRGKAVKKYDFQLWRAALYYSIINYKFKRVVNAIWNIFMLRLMNIFKKNIRITNKLHLIKTRLSIKTSF